MAKKKEKIKKKKLPIIHFVGRFNTTNPHFLRGLLGWQFDQGGRIYDPFF
jgi:hypothetical protein